MGCHVGNVYLRLPCFGCYSAGESEARRDGGLDRVNEGTGL